MKVVITQVGETPKQNEVVILYFEDDADIEVDVIEEDEEHPWVHRGTYRSLTVPELLRRVTLRRGHSL